jgi:hypothetical protein
MIAMMLALLLQDAEPARTNLTDGALEAYAAIPFDRWKDKQGTETVGWHNDVLVVAQFSCSDLCPDNTTRIIHYYVAPGHNCDRIGGVTTSYYVPDGGRTKQPYCVPAVLRNQPGHPRWNPQHHYGTMRELIFYKRYRK